MIARLPRQHAPLRSAAKAALLGAVGFEVLKQIMTFYLASVTSSPSGAVFGSLLGLLVFVYFVSPLRPVRHRVGGDGEGATSRRPRSRSPGRR